MTLKFIWDWVSKMLEIALIREIGYLIIFVAAIFAVAWYLPKLTPELYSFGTARNTKTSITHSRLEYDSVFWQDDGLDVLGRVMVIGPLCPRDYTALAIKRRDKIDTRIPDHTVISPDAYHSQLVCLQCKSEYTLGTKSKTIEDSCDEVRNLFEGKRRREQQIQ